MPHQQSGIVHYLLQVFDPLSVHADPCAYRLPLRHGVVDLDARVEQRLPERQQRLFLLRLRDFQVGTVLTLVEQGLHE